MKIPSRTELRLIKALLDSPLSGKELGKMVSMPKGTFYTLLRRLVEAGWVVVEKGSEDRRERVYALSGSGRDVFPLCRDLLSRLERMG